MELKANELRLNNWVYAFKTTYQIDVNDFDQDKVNTFEPIPLTEEWLFKFGFQYKYGCLLLSTNRGTIQIEEDLAEISSVVTHSGFMSPCKYVHQLQNLYFALTNKELEIKM
jgi:hypothetical protein